jgi:hypothetical protein
MIRGRFEAFLSALIYAWSDFQENCKHLGPLIENISESDQVRGMVLTICGDRTEFIALVSLRATVNCIDAVT